MPDLILYDYWRSSAAYRVRLALGFKGLDYDCVPIDLRQGIQAGPGYRSVNPQGLVPALVVADAAQSPVLTQSLAIIEYLEEVHPAPALLPADPLGRARVRAAAQIIAADIHPINNLRVLRYLKSPLGHTQDAIDAWARHWMIAGLLALEDFAHSHGGRCLYGDSVTLADICLLPQLYNARRIDTDLAGFPRLLAVESHVTKLPFTIVAYPDEGITAA